jgi:ATP-binding cassette, subfamily B, bacterial
MRLVSVVSGRLRARAAGSTRLAALRMFVRASPRLAIAAVVFCLAETVLPNLTLIAMGVVIGHIPAAVTDGLSSPAGHALTVSLTFAGICFALSMLRGPVEDILSAAARARVGTDMQRRLVTAVCAPTGIAHLEDPAVLDRLASAQGELMSYQPADAPMTLVSLIGSRLSGLFACAVLSTFRWWLGPLLLVMWVCVRGPLRGLVTSRVGTFRQKAEPLRRGLYYFYLAWRPMAAKEVRIFGLGDWAAAEGVRLYSEAMYSSWRAVWRLNRRVALSGLLVLAVYTAAVGTIGWSAYHHTIDLRTTATMLPILLATMSIGSVSATDFSLESMLSALPDLDALTHDLTPVGPGPAAGRAATGLPARSIRLEGVGFRYPGGDDEVLAELDLELAAGRSLAIVGVNGAGKTTLVTLLARLRDPTAGRILLDDDPLEEFDARSWQRQVAVVFQDFNRYPLTLAENISMEFGDRRPGACSESESLETVVDRSGATRVVDDVGWDAILSPHYTGGVDLSGGQWQRVALARALYAVERGARLLILDEPTSQLDVRAEAAFYDRFLEITEGTTSVIISHRFSTVRRADRIAVLDGGRITELGTHDELVAADRTYARMFRLQAARFSEVK